MFKKIIISLLLICQLLLLTSCLDSVQLNESSIVQAIGIDYQDGVYQITLQIFSPAGTGSSTQIDASQNNTATLFTEGKTLDEAINKANTIQGKEIFTGHNRIIVIGEDFAIYGIDSMFSYFDKNALTRQNVTLLVADGSAYDILSTNIEQSVLSAEVIEMMVDNSATSGYILKTTYHEASKNMYLYNGSAVIPIISKNEDSSSDNSSSESESSSNQGSNTIPSLSALEIKNTAVFSEYSMQGVLNEDETKALVFLSDNISSANIVVEDDDYKTTVNVYKNSTTVTASENTSSDEISINFNFSIKSEASCDEIILPYGENTPINFIQTIEEKIEYSLSSQCIDLLNKIFKEYKSDVFYLNELLFNLNPAISDDLGEDFYESSDFMNFSCEVDFLIDRTGLSVESMSNN